MTQSITEQIDTEILAVLKKATAPMSMEEIAEEVTNRVDCKLTDVERRVRYLPEVEQGGRLWRLADED